VLSIFACVRYRKSTDADPGATLTDGWPRNFVDDTDRHSILGEDNGGDEANGSCSGLANMSKNESHEA